MSLTHVGYNPSWLNSYRLYFSLLTHGVFW